MPRGFRSLFGSLVRLLTIASLSALTVACGGGSSPPQPPRVGATSFSTDEHQLLSASLGLSDPQGQAMVVTVTTQPSHATVSVPTAAVNST